MQCQFYEKYFKVEILLAFSRKNISQNKVIDIQTHSYYCTIHFKLSIFPQTLSLFKKKITVNIS